ncbi:MAG TPA: phosphatidate cytidylyltransferase [Verrucomicrobiae bacterium]|nr:phosphatidate cytidylyltransferase [Verrucomicrobiae bacterium]
MSPQAALHSEIFRNYVLIIASILAAAGLALSVLRWGLRKNVSSIWATYRSWLVMAPVVLGCILAGRTVVIVFFCVLAVLGFKEFARATGLYRDWWMMAAVYLSIVATGVSCLVHQPQGQEPGDGWYGLFVVLPVYAIALILLVPILRNQIKGQLQLMSLSILGFVYLGWMFGHLAFFANASNAYGYLLYILFATEINDVAAFTFGKLFGKHPFRSNISPKKTWEGSLGALAVSMALPWALRFSFPRFGARELIVTGLIVGVGGQLGDLAISVIKRDIGVKDMGAGIPGHGGILDRTDSLIFTAPLFFHMVRYFYDLR